ncbi:hypothetical protein Droror1_Dr00000992 [Drosera rotundifolia]
MNTRCFQRHLSLPPHPARPVPLPSPMEAHLWCVVPQEVKSLSLLNEYMKILSPCEQENVLSFRGEELQKSALLARALVRTTIARYMLSVDHKDPQVDPKSFKFKKNIYGKPEVDWQQPDGQSPPPLHFNVSHTSSLIACGVSLNSHIGIDVEEKGRVMKSDVLSFSQRFFCPDEVEHLAAISDSRCQRQEFIKLWTLKEAYVKALGRGFSAAPFDSFSIHYEYPVTSRSGPYLVGSKVPEISVQTVDKTSLTSNWHFALMELAGAHYAAICLEKANTVEGKEESPMNLVVWKTIPFSEDVCLSGTTEVVTICGSVKQSRPDYC